MDVETVRIVVIVCIGAVAGLWLLSTFIWRVSGTWERVLSQAEVDEGGRAERITLGQLGPLVTGRRDVKGGHQEFSGLVVGRRLSLTRRDHGRDAVKALGFPDGVAEKVDGEVMARFRLSLVDDSTALVGSFEPQKIEFTHQPPRITKTYFLPGQERTYRRVEPVRMEAMSKT